MHDRPQKREYICYGLGYRIIDTGAVVNPDVAKVIAGGAKVEFRMAHDAARVWYGAWSVLACGFGTGFAVVFPAEAALRDYGVRVERPVSWVEAGAQPRGGTREELGEAIRRAALAWLREEAGRKPWYEDRIHDVIEAVRTADLGAPAAARRPGLAAARKTGEAVQLSLW